MVRIIRINDIFYQKSKYFLLSFSDIISFNLHTVYYSYVNPRLELWENYLIEKVCFNYFRWI